MGAKNRLEDEVLTVGLGRAEPPRRATHPGLSEHTRAERRTTLPFGVSCVCRGGQAELKTLSGESTPLPAEAVFIHVGGPQGTSVKCKDHLKLARNSLD